MRFPTISYVLKQRLRPAYAYVQSDQSLCLLLEYSVSVRLLNEHHSVIFLPARPASQTHDSHKGRMILNHVNPAGRIKNCGEKSAFKNLQLSF